MIKTTGMSTKTLLTLEQFFELPESDQGVTYELDEGELIVMPPSPAKHERIKNRIARILNRLLNDKGLGEVHVESGFVLDAESWRRPDVAFIRSERLRQIDNEKPFQGSPDLAIEVYSPPQSRGQLARKVQHFLEAGTQTVWVVYPDTKEVNVLASSGERWLGEEDTLEAPELVPGFSVVVRELFQLE
jgi:Uma2 family endonuclease